MSSNITAQYIRSIADEFGFYSGLFNLISGLCGNLFIILIFVNMKVFRGNQCSFYLTIESWSDIGLLIGICLGRILNKILGYDLVLVSIFWCKIRTTLAQACGLCSVYIICATTFDQYLSTNHRYSLRQMSTLKLAHRLTIFIIGFCILHSIIFFIYTEIQPTMGCIIYNTLLKKYVSFFYYPILSNILPLVITCTCSLLAYYNVRRIIRRQMPIVRRRLDRQLTAMVLGRVICLIVLGLPFIIITLYSLNLNTSDENYMVVVIVGFVGAICYFLLYVNFSITFYVFLAISSRFRRQVKQFLVKQCWRSLKIQFLTTTRRIHSHENQVAPQVVQEHISMVESIAGA